jgi:hypothetical protein
MNERRPPVPRLSRPGLVTLAALLSLLAGCGRPAAPPPPPADWQPRLETWRSEREAGLKRPNGWLSLVGLWWLQPGETPFGSDPSLPIALPPGSAPERAGTLVLEGDTVTLRPAPGAAVAVNGTPATDGMTLAPDASGKPDVVTVGRVSFTVIRRGSKVGVRAKDPESPALAQFHGLAWYPPDPAWRIPARFERAAEPKQVTVPSAGGVEQPMWALGVAHFTLDGRERTLISLGGSPDDKELFFVFKDRTTGEETYGAGRFLDADAPGPDGGFVLDFNTAYNPPCAFTPFATCPLPPKENALDVAVRAGEKKYAGGH